MIIKTIKKSKNQKIKKSKNQNIKTAKSHWISVQKVDVFCFQESLGLMRIDEGIQHDLWSITMGIFNLGNVKFKKEGDGFAAIDPSSMKYLEGISANKLTQQHLAWYFTFFGT